MFGTCGQDVCSSCLLCLSCYSSYNMKVKGVLKINCFVKNEPISNSTFPLSITKNKAEYGTIGSDGDALMLLDYNYIQDSLGLSNTRVHAYVILFIQSVVGL